MSEGLRKRTGKDVLDPLDLWNRQSLWLDYEMWDLWNRQSLRLDYEMWDGNLKWWSFELVGKSITSLVSLV
jgi:hypothetical protein